MRAKLAGKKFIAEGTLHLEFEGEEEISFVPGQFFRLTLVNPKYTDERGNSRFVGFVNVPNIDKKIIAVVRLGPSAFKKTLAEAEIGLEVEIDGVDGKMTLPSEIDKEIVIVTGGIGITPMICLLRWEKEKFPGHKITLIYSNTNRKRAIFLEELQEYAESIPDFRLITIMTQDPDWEGESRRIDMDFLKEKINLGENNLYYITGTPRFVPDMVKHLRNLGVNLSQMKYEIFTGY